MEQRKGPKETQRGASDQRQCRNSPLRAQEGSCFFLGSWNMVGVPMARGPGEGSAGKLLVQALGTWSVQAPAAPSPREGQLQTLADIDTGDEPFSAPTMSSDIETAAGQLGLCGCETEPSEVTVGYAHPPPPRVQAGARSAAGTRVPTQQRAVHSLCPPRSPQEDFAGTLGRSWLERDLLMTRGSKEVPSKPSQSEMTSPEPRISFWGRLRGSRTFHTGAEGWERPRESGGPFCVCPSPRQCRHPAKGPLTAPTHVSSPCQRGCV